MDGPWAVWVQFLIDAIINKVSQHITFQPLKLQIPELALKSQVNISDAQEFGSNLMTSFFNSNHPHFHRNQMILSASFLADYTD